MIQIIKKEDHKIMDWLNGKGKTSEISRFPESDPFLWRLSMAPVVECGQFSFFKGYHRYITLVDGETLKLNEYSLNKGDVYDFPGDAITYGDLPNGKIVDLNFIVVKDMYRVHYQIINLKSDSFELICDGDVNFIFCINGIISANFSSQSESLRAMDSFKIENCEEIFCLSSSTKMASFAFIKLTKKGPK